MNDHWRKWFAKTAVDERERVALAAGTTVGHLRQLAGGHRRASAELAERLEAASDGELAIAFVRPDLLQFARRVLSQTTIQSGAANCLTLNQTISDAPSARQSDTPSVNLSSTSQASG